MGDKHSSKPRTCDRLHETSDQVVGGEKKEEEEGDVVVSHALLFQAGEVVSVAVGPKETVPRHVESFFLPDGEIEVLKSSRRSAFAFNFIFNETTNGASLVCYHRKEKRLGDSERPRRRDEESRYVATGVCLLSKQPLVNKLRHLLGIFARRCSFLKMSCGWTGSQVERDASILRDLVRTANISPLSLSPRAAAFASSPSSPSRHQLHQQQRQSDGVSGTGGREELGEEDEEEEQDENFGYSSESLQELDFSLRLLFEVLAVDKVLEVYTCLLEERKVLLISERYSVLTVVAESFRALLAPLDWCHVYAPVLPRSMLDHLQAPVPFLIGINQRFAFKSDFPFLLDAVVVNLDEGSVQIPAVSATGGEGSEALAAPPKKLPRVMLDWMSKALHAQLCPLAVSADEVLAPGAAPETAWKFPSGAVRRIFRIAVEELLADAKLYSVPVLHQGERMVLFEEDAFVRAQAFEHSSFFDAFVRTQAFSLFLTRTAAA